MELIKDSQLRTGGLVFAIIGFIIIFIVNSIIDDTEYNVIADLNEDGIINVVDIVAIVNIILNY